MVAPVLHILPIAIIQRERVLPIVGKVVARKGQRVSAVDTVVEGNMSPEHLIVDVARALNLPPEKAERLIKRRLGDYLEEGDILAERSVMGFPRTSTAPRAGVIVAIHRGQVFLELASHPFELKAGIPGEVIELVPDHGAVIQTTGALIQGVWGNGRIDFGLLNAQIKTPDDVLTADRIDVSMRGTVVLGGHCVGEDVLAAAAEVPLKGLIVTSIASKLIPTAMKMRYPIILLEGFGRISMNSVAFKLLTTNNRREITLNAECNTDRRPEAVIPLPAPENIPPLNDINRFKEGQRVRVVRAPYMGLVGTLNELRPGKTLIENGLKLPVGGITLENGQKAILPLANLQILE